MAAISVVMSTYNTSVPILKEAVESILNQTFRDFEFIIIDDGSTNDAPAYLHTLSDPRIQISRNEVNIGITKSLNIGFRKAQGKYIARMDSDDISFPDRFEKQFAFMESHPEAIVCGSTVVAPGQARSFQKRKIEGMDSYRVKMLFRNPGPAHPTAFLRREKLIQYHIEYDESLRYSQDYGLWTVISQYGDICILPEALIAFRKHEGQITSMHREKQIQCDKVTQRKLLTQLLGNVTEEEVDLHYTCSTGYFPDAKISPQVGMWYDRLVSANREKRIYDQVKLKQYIVMIKEKLIRQTYTEDMSGFQKMMLYLRYIPLGTALQKTVYQGLLNLRNALYSALSSK